MPEGGEHDGLAVVLVADHAEGIDAPLVHDLPHLVGELGTADLRHLVGRRSGQHLTHQFARRPAYDDEVADMERPLAAGQHLDPPLGIGQSALIAPQVRRAPLLGRGGEGGAAQWARNHDSTPGCRFRR